MMRRFLVEIDMNEGEYLTAGIIQEAIEFDFSPGPFPGTMSVEELDI